MSSNLNCAAMGYNCVFSITAANDQHDFMFDTVAKHALTAHPELIDDTQALKPEVKQKLRELLSQAKYSDPTQ